MGVSGLTSYLKGKARSSRIPLSDGTVFVDGTGFLMRLLEQLAKNLVETDIYNNYVSVLCGIPCADIVDAYCTLVDCLVQHGCRVRIYLDGNAGVDPALELRRFREVLLRAEKHAEQHSSVADCLAYKSGDAEAVRDASRLCRPKTTQYFYNAVISRMCCRYVCELVVEDFTVDSKVSTSTAGPVSFVQCGAEADTFLVKDFLHAAAAGGRANLHRPLCILALDSDFFIFSGIRYAPLTEVDWASAPPEASTYTSAEVARVLRLPPERLWEFAALAGCDSTRWILETFNLVSKLGISTAQRTQFQDMLRYMCQHYNFDTTGQPIKCILDTPTILSMIDTVPNARESFDATYLFYHPLDSGYVSQCKSSRTLLKKAPTLSATLQSLYTCHSNSFCRKLLSAAVTGFVLLPAGSFPIAAGVSAVHGWGASTLEHWRTRSSRALRCVLYALAGITGVVEHVCFSRSSIRPILCTPSVAAASAVYDLVPCKTADQFTKAMDTCHIKYDRVWTTLWPHLFADWASRYISIALELSRSHEKEVNREYAIFAMAVLAQVLHCLREAGPELSECMTYEGLACVVYIVVTLMYSGSSTNAPEFLSQSKLFSVESVESLEHARALFAMSGGNDDGPDHDHWESSAVAASSSHRADTSWYGAGDTSYSWGTSQAAGGTSKKAPTMRAVRCLALFHAVSDALDLLGTLGQFLGLPFPSSRMILIDSTMFVTCFNHFDTSESALSDALSEIPLFSDLFTAVGEDLMSALDVITLSSGNEPDMDFWGGVDEDTMEDVPQHELDADPKCVGNEELLPVHSHRTRILAAIEACSIVCIHGATGCGKSSIVPLLVHDKALLDGKKARIICTQPRRIAATTLATRVASILNSPVGQRVGFAIHGDIRASARSEVIFLTTGFLVQYLLHNSSDDGLRIFGGPVTHLVLDEAHERDLDLDFLFFLLRHRQVAHLKLLIMSATVSFDGIKRYFKGSFSGKISKTFFVGARAFPTKILHIDEFAKEHRSILRLSDSIQREVGHCLSQPRSGGLLPVSRNLGKLLLDATYALLEANTKPGRCLLIFLPGEMEILEIQERIDAAIAKKEPRFDNLELIVMHSLVMEEEHEKAFVPLDPSIRRVVLATNIAESSVTIPAVEVVIDACMQRAVFFNPQRGSEYLTLVLAAKASLQQRTGRCGRLMPGTSLRALPSEFVKKSLPIDMPPDMSRVRLDGVVIRVRELLSDFGDVLHVLRHMPTPPEEKDISAAVQYLYDFGALHSATHDSIVTSTGKLYASAPMSLQASRLVEAAVALDWGVFEAICVSALEMVNAEPLRAPNFLQFSGEDDDFRFSKAYFEAFMERARFDGHRKSDAFTAIAIVALGFANPQLIASDKFARRFRVRAIREVRSACARIADVISKAHCVHGASQQTKYLLRDLKEKKLPNGYVCCFDRSAEEDLMFRTMLHYAFPNQIFAAQNVKQTANVTELSLAVRKVVGITVDDRIPDPRVASEVFSRDLTMLLPVLVPRNCPASITAAQVSTALTPVVTSQGLQVKSLDFRGFKSIRWGVHLASNKGGVVPHAVTAWLERTCHDPSMYCVVPLWRTSLFGGSAANYAPVVNAAGIFSAHRKWTSADEAVAGAQAVASLARLKKVAQPMVLPLGLPPGAAAAQSELTLDLRRVNLGSPLAVKFICCSMTHGNTIISGSSILSGISSTPDWPTYAIATSSMYVGADGCTIIPRLLTMLPPNGLIASVLFLASWSPISPIRVGLNTNRTHIVAFETQYFVHRIPSPGLSVPLFRALNAFRRNWACRLYGSSIVSSTEALASFKSVFTIALSQNTGPHPAVPGHAMTSLKHVASPFPLALPIPWEHPNGFDPENPDPEITSPLLESAILVHTPADPCENVDATDSSSPTCDFVLQISRVASENSGPVLDRSLVVTTSLLSINLLDHDPDDALSNIGLRMGDLLYAMELILERLDLPPWLDLFHLWHLSPGESHVGKTAYIGWCPPPLDEFSRDPNAVVPSREEREASMRISKLVATARRMNSPTCHADLKIDHLWTPVVLVCKPFLSIPLVVCAPTTDSVLFRLVASATGLSSLSDISSELVKMGMRFSVSTDLSGGVYVVFFLELVAWICAIRKASPEELSFISQKVLAAAGKSDVGNIRNFVAAVLALRGEYLDSDFGVGSVSGRGNKRRPKKKQTDHQMPKLDLVLPLPAAFLPECIPWQHLFALLDISTDAPDSNYGSLLLLVSATVSASRYKDDLFAHLRSDNAFGLLDATLGANSSIGHQAVWSVSMARIMLSVPLYTAFKLEDIPLPGVRDKLMSDGLFEPQSQVGLALPFGQSVSLALSSPLKSSDDSNREAVTLHTDSLSFMFGEKFHWEYLLSWASLGVIFLDPSNGLPRLGDLETAALQVSVLPLPVFFQLTRMIFLHQTKQRRKAGLIVLNSQNVISSLLDSIGLRSGEVRSWTLALSPHGSREAALTASSKKNISDTQVDALMTLSTVDLQGSWASTLSASDMALLKGLVACTNKTQRKAFAKKLSPALALANPTPITSLGVAAPALGELFSAVVNSRVPGLIFAITGVLVYTKAPENAQLLPQGNLFHLFGISEASVKKLIEHLLSDAGTALLSNLNTSALIKLLVVIDAVIPKSLVNTPVGRRVFDFMAKLPLDRTTLTIVNPHYPWTRQDQSIVTFVWRCLFSTTSAIPTAELLRLFQSFGAKRCSVFLLRWQRSTVTAFATRFSTTTLVSLKALSIDSSSSLSCDIFTQIAAYTKSKSRGHQITEAFVNAATNLSSFH